MRLLIASFFIGFLYSCNHKKDQFYWLYPDGEMHYIYRYKRSVTDSTLYQRLTYSSVWEEFIINFKTKKGVHRSNNSMIGKGNLVFIGIIGLKRDCLDSIYIYGGGYGDSEYDNEVNFYVSPQFGVLAAKSPHNNYFGILSCRTLLY